MTTPQIPPRPSRSQDTHASNNPNPNPNSMEVPKIPPRPKRSIDRSMSPNRDSYTRSPLNDPAFLHNKPPRENSLNVELPSRPPSVSLPSIGQEGSEYASFEDLSKTLPLSRTTSREEHVSSPKHTKIVGDLPLHAPTASVPASTAKTRIQTVTRTDSSQAVAVGIGKLAPEDKPGHAPSSGRSDSSAGIRTRPGSVYKDEEEHGIPEIGLQVPMYPNAGDVQAPSPAPFEQGVPTGIGFFNKGGHPSGRHHGRTKSGREVFHGPPGSYGLHGHGVVPKDEFEQQWYAKHPDDHRREKAGEYGPHIRENRKDYHWVGDDLVKLVHSSGKKGVGIGTLQSSHCYPGVMLTRLVGTSREAIGTPDEQIGYLASEEYASRMASPRPTSGRPASIQGGVHVESPLKKKEFAQGELSREQTEEGEAEEVIHIDPPSHRASKIHGGGYDPPTEDLGPEGGNTEEEGGWVSERGYGVPILASDEISKHPGAEWRQPAVDPELERRRSGEYTINDPDGHPEYITKQRPHSRSSSRNNNTQSKNQLQRFTTPSEQDRGSTPLESTKEYEPLFPEDDEAPKRAKTATDKVRRPDLARHHFPSQDVWEDTPSSLQLETTVDTPQAEEDPQTPGGEVSASKVFEKPETEAARKENITEEDQQSFLPEHTRKFANKHLNREQFNTPHRPGMQQRFPSHDIWEDAPEHGHLETTVSGPQSMDTNEYLEDSPAVEKPTVPARPSVPARPQKEATSTDKKAPGIPEGSKPQLPSRPAKTLSRSSEKVPTSDSPAEAPQPKAKPPVPPRPGGSKIAALQAGFLQDLNSKLGLGPQAPKIKEPEPEKEEEPPKPLQDARKGRAKGPQRRKPTSSPGPAAATVTAEMAVPRAKLEMSSVSTVWTIDDAGDLDVPAARMAEKLEALLKDKEEPKPSEAREDEDTTEGTQEKGKATEAEGSSLAQTLTQGLGKLTSPVTQALSKFTGSDESASAPNELSDDEDKEELSSAQGGVLLDDKANVDPPAPASATGNAEQEASVGEATKASEPAAESIPEPIDPETLKAPEHTSKLDPVQAVQAGNMPGAEAIDPNEQAQIEDTAQAGMHRA
jgi:hypothetical protein